jgi:hypothetical protein
MEDARREEIIGEVAKYARGWLEGASQHYPEGFDVGVVGIAFDLHMPDGTAAVGYCCSDGREWVHSGLFRSAMLEADARAGEPGDD